MTSKVVSYKVTDLKSLDENWGYIQEDTPEGSLVPVPKSVVEWIKELEKTKNGILTRNVELIGENAQLTMQVRELESQLPKWISVEDVLPQWGKLVKIKFKDGKEDERRFSADYKWVSKGMQTCESVDVTHWMPLPPPSTTEESSAIEKEM